MILFLFAFFLLYGALHLYIFLKIKGALVFGTVPSIFLIFFMGIMICAPVIVRISEKHGLDFSARLVSHIGYTWMGIAFLFFSFSVIFDLYRFFVYGGALIFHRDFSHLVPSPRFAFVAPLLVSTIIASYGYFEARDIRTETIIIKTSKIPKGIGKLTIVQLSDVHLGLIVRQARLKRILKEIKQANPAILVSTGDLVDGQIDSLPGLAELLKTINPKYGKFAITGNHEFYAGIDQALNFTEKAGFSVLRGEALTLDGLINIAGVDDPAGKIFGLFREVSEKELLSGLPREKFTLLLKHRPLVDKSALGLFDLQLSGHTHKGQIFPFSLITRLYFPADAGRFDLTNNSYLYVSRGAGTWGPPIRFLSPPEVTVIELVHNDRN
ncbi:MAG: metallophosphoesterase [Deltaproteobacteria bacterium]|nr:metallophosphoesterase [Deltaproteobacteria bacterium]